MNERELEALLERISQAIGPAEAKALAVELMAGYAAQANRWHLYYSVARWLTDVPTA